MRSPTHPALFTPYETLFDWKGTDGFSAISHGNDVLEVDRVFCGRKVELDRERHGFLSQVLGVAFVFSSTTLPPNVAKRRGNRLTVSGTGAEGHLFKKTSTFPGFEAYPKTAIPFSIVHHGLTGSICVGDLTITLTRSGAVGSTTYPELLPCEEVKAFLIENLPSIMSQAFFDRAGWQLALASGR